MLPPAKFHRAANNSVTLGFKNPIFPTQNNTKITKPNRMNIPAIKDDNLTSLISSSLLVRFLAIDLTWTKIIVEIDETAKIDVPSPVLIDALKYQYQRITFFRIHVHVYG